MYPITAIINYQPHIKNLYIYLYLMQFFLNVMSVGSQKPNQLAYLRKPLKCPQAQKKLLAG